MTNNNVLANAIGIVAVVVAIGSLTVIGKQSEPEPTVRVECKFTVPQIMLAEGWKVMGPEDEPWLNELSNTGKAEKVPIPNLVSCTRYEKDKTPVTVKYDLVMWRVNA